LPEPHDKVPADQQLDVGAIVSEVEKRGIEARGVATIPEIVALIAREARANDVILVMSNGSFGGLIPELLSVLERRTGG
jgi:UDP-N-acetylmuramate: L-alanyl-gamma-D-glutamyl-meso-diaminopimelate ligase